jgi:hypothetical protein
MTAPVPNYREQTGCHNCCHVLEVTDFDDNSPYGIYYCTLNALPRPLSGSLAMGEGPRSRLAKQYGYDANAWCEWRNKHNAHPAGICDAWEIEEPSEPIDELATFGAPRGTA